MHFAQVMVTLRGAGFCVHSFVPPVPLVVCGVGHTGRSFGIYASEESADHLLYIIVSGILFSLMQVQNCSSDGVTKKKKKKKKKKQKR